MSSGPGGASSFEMFWPADPCGTGVLVLCGSSGAIEHDRAEMLSGHGAVAMAMRWFGGPGQQPGPWEVPLELFVEALDRLAPEVDRLAIIGTSFGAEAALCVGIFDRRVSAVVGIAPSAYVWAGIDPAGQMTSHWTWRGEALDFVPLDQTWTSPTQPPVYRTLYQQSLQTFSDRVDAATIPVEQIAGQVVLIAGEDDQVWPSADWARTVAARRAQAGLATTVVTHPDAGHRVVLPGERPTQRGQAMERGGTDHTNAELGTMAWPHLQATLHLNT